jgi:ankyrin repeat protein
MYELEKIIKTTELIRLCSNSHINLQEIKSHLSDKKSELNYINLKDDCGYTALMSCIIANKPDVFELLIKCGADLSIKDAHNRSIYDLLSLWGLQYTIPTTIEAPTDLIKMCSE